MGGSVVAGFWNSQGWKMAEMTKFLLASNLELFFEATSIPGDAIRTYSNQGLVHSKIGLAGRSPELGRLLARIRRSKRNLETPGMT